MKKHRLIFYFIFFTSAAFYSQQLTFEKAYQRIPGFSYHFNERFTSEPEKIAVIWDGSFYRSKKVKKIMVYSNNNTLAFLFELDTAGKIITSGFESAYYFALTSSKGTNPYTYVQSYYKNSVLIMADSTFSEQIIYRHHDTVMHFKRTNQIIYRSGSLLNEQNEYYNHKYLRKRIEEKGLIKIRWRNCLGITTKRHVFLWKKLPVNYDPQRLYVTCKSTEEAGFTAIKDSVSNIDTLALTRHPFYRSYHPARSTKNLVRGENFDEPDNYVEPWSCSYSRRYMRLESPPTYEFTQDASGLYDAYYNTYYLPETDTAVINKYRAGLKKKKEAAQYRTDGIYIETYNDPNPPAKIPARSLVYYIRYEYFNKVTGP